MGKSNTVKSSSVRFGKRTFFFDVDRAANSKKYLRITESRFVEEGKDRIRNSVVLFPDDVAAFKKNMEDMTSALV